MCLATRLRRDLTAAIEARDIVAVGASRSALAAVDNAEAIDVTDRSRHEARSEYIAGSTEGLGAAEVARRALRDADVEVVAQAQVDGLSTAARHMESWDARATPIVCGRRPSYFSGICPRPSSGTGCGDAGAPRGDPGRPVP